VQGRRILLIISGGIAAYKSLELIRRLRERGCEMRCVLTAGGAQFVTPLAVAALSEHKTYTDLFSLTDESEMGHIRLSREADLVVVAPASADLMAKMAAGLADDLASTVLLATDKPVLLAPAMNTMMWQHAATQRNRARLEADGIMRVGPAAGDLACGEVGSGRMAEPADIIAAIDRFFALRQSLSGVRALVTSGPTFEPIDPVRFIGNRSSGKQGHAIAAALAAAGAAVTLVSGPSAEPDPPGASVVRIGSAEEMLAACREALPAEVVVCAAAVSDWRVREHRGSKIKKDAASSPPVLELIENPDILTTLGNLERDRPPLVIGFAAETESVVENARTKLRKKGCDWILANDVSAATGVFGGEENKVFLVTGDGVEEWPAASKREIGRRLAERIADALGRQREIEA